MSTLRTIENDFLFLIYDVAQLIRRHADSRAREGGMTRAQWAVLARLERQPGITQNELAHLTDVEPITVGRLIDRLEAGGFVTRRADAKDRRIWRLHLTEKSASLLEQIAAFRTELNSQMSEGIAPEVLAHLTQGLQSMRANLSAARPGRRKEATR